MAVGARGIAAVLAGGALAVAASVAPAATAATATPATPPVTGGPAAAGPAAAGPAAAPAPVSWAPVATAAIRPGVLTDTAGAGRCTANFVFTAGERTFLGQAAHCAGTGAATETDGCDSATRPLGTPVTINAVDGTRRAGTLAYSSWVTMQETGESDPDTCAHNDFALVEVGPGDVADVNPSVPFFGGPTGLDTDGLPPGAGVYTSGGAPARRGTAAAATTRPKAGVSAGDVGGGRGHEIYTLSPGIPGDSGTAFLDADGDAVGLLSTLNLSPLPVSNGVTDLARALAYLDASGAVGDVELALGTEPFTDTPAGVPPAALALPPGPVRGDQA